MTENSGSLAMTAPGEVYRTRRARLASGLSRPIVVFAGQARPRQYATNLHPFRAGSNYLYLGGPPLAGAAWLIEPGSDGERGATLLRPPPDFEDAVWVGMAPKDDEIASSAGIAPEAIFAPGELGEMLKGRRAAYVAPPCLLTMEFIGRLGLQAAKPEEQQLLIDSRLFKDQYEIAALRRAAKAAVSAHRAAMVGTVPGSSEAGVAGRLLAGFATARCIPSFTPIVTVRGEVLHCESYPNELKAGQLLLADAGAEEPGGYASDITRTYPVSGEFTAIQRQIYETVLRAERVGIAACVPGRRYRDVHDLAAGAICEGLVEAEILRGDPVELTARGAHTLFFVHGVGHLLGLDVHDMEDFGDLAGYAPGRERRSDFGSKFLRLDRDLQAGMAVTIEPGVYFIPQLWERTELTAPFADVVNRAAVDTLLEARFGGIRIEDDVLVRGVDADGPEVLTDELPTDADEVTAIVGSEA